MWLLLICEKSRRRLRAVGEDRSVTPECLREKDSLQSSANRSRPIVVPEKWLSPATVREVRLQNRGKHICQ